jgi:hypothetical protein
MGTVTGPWKQLLINALESNVHLKHSSFFQLVRPLIFILFFLEVIFSKISNFVDVLFGLVLGNNWIKWETFESHSGFQVTLSPSLPLSPSLSLCVLEL